MVLALVATCVLPDEEETKRAAIAYFTLLDLHDRQSGDSTSDAAGSASAWFSRAQVASIGLDSSALQCRRRIAVRLWADRDAIARQLFYRCLL